jgi:hypothetical protein
MPGRTAVRVGCCLRAVHPALRPDATCLGRWVDLNGWTGAFGCPIAGLFRCPVRLNAGTGSAWRAAAIVVVWLGLAGCSSEKTITPGILDADCCVNGFCVDDGPAKAERCFGQPDSTKRHYVGVCDDTLTLWFYRGMTLKWSSSNRLHCMVIRSAEYRMPRAPNVGDSIQVAVRLLGEPTRGGYTYETPARGREAGPSIIFNPDSEIIRSFYVGWLCR